MRSFKFRLESVLVLRSREEDIARQAYAEAVSYRNRCQELLDQAILELQNLQEELVCKRSVSSHRNEQLTYIHAIRQQGDFCSTVSQRLSRSEQLVRLRLEQWMIARRKTQMLEKIKIRQLGVHSLAMQRLEERILDDLVVATHPRSFSEVIY